jgi:glycyl-tRNA synthetase
VAFKEVLQSSRKKLPLGIGQVGKSFRNEISPGNFLFRTREFEQMELQYYCDPAASGEKFHYWVDFCTAWLAKYGIRPENVRNHVCGGAGGGSLPHYAAATTDIEYKGPFGWGEMISLPLSPSLSVCPQLSLSVFPQLTQSL